MRIIFLSPHSDPQAKLGEPDAGGQCLYENELATELAKNGNEVLVFCRQRNKHPAVSKIIPGYTIHRITAGGEKFIPKERIAAVLPEFTNKVISILNNLKRKNVKTVVHGHYWDGAMAALLLKANYHDYPFVWTPHSLGFTKRDKFKGLSYEAIHHFIPRLMWENYAVSIADNIICSTRDEKRKLIKFYTALSEKTEVIPPGLFIGASDKQQFYLKKWGIKPGTRILLCLGRMARTKGYQHAVRILKELSVLTKEKHMLVIVGGGTKITAPEESQYLRELKRLAVNLGVSDRIVFQPSVPHEDVQSIYALSDFYLMTAEEEPFGLTVIEAMAAKCVVLAHNRGGTKNIIQNNQTGFVIDMHKYNSAAVLLSRLLIAKKYSSRIGERASNAATSKYSWTSRLPQFEKVYKELNSPFSKLNKISSQDSFFNSITRITRSTTQVLKLPKPIYVPQPNFIRADRMI